MPTLNSLSEVHTVSPTNLVSRPTEWAVSDVSHFRVFAKRSLEAANTVIFGLYGQPSNSWVCSCVGRAQAIYQP